MHEMDDFPMAEWTPKLYLPLKTVDQHGVLNLDAVFLTAQKLFDSLLYQIK
jgi:hypothetical protein